MGKREKRQKHQQRNARRGACNYYEEEEDTSSYQLDLPTSSSLSDEEKEMNNSETPSKFLLYQQSVQSPKGDISYLLKFFLMYVGGRLPLHLQEDFCGTAFLSTEWLRSDSRRTAIGLDLDLEALTWCTENNISKVGADGYSRISLFHGNVLQPLESKLVKTEPQGLIRNLTLEENKECIETDVLESTAQVGSMDQTNGGIMRNFPLSARDIVCAFNYSCCCLHKRAELVCYFKHVLEALSKKGGIFVMDLYGGTSSEHKLRLQRRFSNFTYIWEQAEFDIIERKTRISLHFHLKQQRKLRHAFSYSWRLWTLPEIRDCLEEAGFQTVHFWLREMPGTEENKTTDGFGVGRDVKYKR
ncbi:S-adenosyl-L-methionine-dependent methyltransferases superfamily protein [Quillaja saponaria]|uniref:S-adenosyl-L-methionine-dependent methyltransferases superfamily protein n=1 Tax=Quillaja saponaria TaxID=32244 RepID=A0AAD7KY73_QUISA|nr:S-adenosyl-L-methionine-dependent methyltransferases superfamily protein [Quillaja saponaria]